MRAKIYDAALLPLTSRWYRAVLERLSPGDSLLDIGVGTAGALMANADIVRNLDLTVLGIDIDQDYLDRAQQLIDDQGLGAQVEVRLQDVYKCEDGPFDGAYFSASYMLLPDPPKALAQIMSQLTPDGRIYFTQTFQVQRSPLMEKMKPLLKKLTTIDFGTVTYEEDFRASVASVGMEIEDMVELGSHGARSYRMIVGKPPQD